jgi:hypothetical protein
MGMAGNVGNQDDTDSDDTETEIMLNSPLSTGVFKNSDDPLVSVRTFVASAVKQFEEELDVHINRNTDLLPQVLRKYKNPAFDLTKPLNVCFADEPGLDAGGVTREYFYLLMRRLQRPAVSLNLFEGLNGHLLPIHNYDILSGGIFVIVGKMMLHSILNNCTGLPGLSPAVAAYLLTGSRDAAVEDITLADVPDPVIQDMLNKVGSMYVYSLF